MLAFRSEVHVERWSESRRIPCGETFSLEQAQGLGRAWYADKLSPDWHRATPEEANALFGSIGLQSGFWRLS